MRIRSIKPDYWKDRVTGRWADDMQLLYAGLWNFADDDGRFEWEPDLVRSELFPYKPGWPVAEVLEKLRQTGRVVGYEVEGCLYGWMPSFRKHQHPDKPKKSTLPEPPPLAFGEPSLTVPLLVPTKAPRDMEVEVDMEVDMDLNRLPGAEVGSRPEPPADDSPPTEFGAFVREHWPDVRDVAVKERAWTEAFPGVNLLGEARKAFAWERSDPKRRKSNHGRFLNGWFGRAQDAASRGVNAPRGALPPAPQSGYEGGPRGFG